MVARRAVVEISGELQDLPSGDTLLGVTFQNVYDNSSSARVVLSAANGPLRIADNATPIAGDLFEIEDNAGANYFSVSASDVDIGFGARRTVQAIYGTTTGRGGFELWPDTMTITSGLGTGGNTLAAFQWTGTMTTSIAGGGAIGNDSFGGFISITGEFIFADQGNLFNSGLLFNFGMTASLEANIGPLYTLINQPKFRSTTAGAKTVSQHNALRCQSAWGPNTAGSITQTNCTYILFFATVDGSLGAASVTTFNYMQALNPSLVGGGTIGTLNVLDIANITGPTTIRGINSAMGSGTFIRHTGAAPALFTAANFRFNDGFGVELGTGQDVLLNWSGSAFEWDPAVGDDLRITFAANQHTFTSSSASVLRAIHFGMPKAAFGQTSAIGNQKFVFAANAETWSGGGSSIDQVLLTQAGNDTVDTVNVGRFSGWAINAPSITIDATNRVTTITGLTIAGSMSVSGDTVTNKAGLHITSSPSGGTGINAAIWVTAGNTQLDGTLTHTGSDLGLYGATPTTQAADPVALTDSSGGTADNTVQAVSGSRDDATINDNFADLTAKYNAIRAMLSETAGGVGIAA